MAAKKDPAKKKLSSAADFRKKEEEDKRIARETKRNPKDASGNSYFGAGYPKGGNPKTPGAMLPAGTPFKPRKPQPNVPKPNPKTPSTTPPKRPTPTTTTTTVPPRGMNQLGKMVGAKQEELAKKKKKK